MALIQRLKDNSENIVVLVNSVPKKDKMPTWIIIVVFVLINIGLAKYDAYRIKKNMPIDHMVNAITYFIITIAFYKWLTPLQVLGLLLIRIPIFNTSLNIFRGLPPTHLSTTTDSVIDRIMNPIIKKIGYWFYNTILLGLAAFLMYI